MIKKATFDEFLPLEDLIPEIERREDIGFVIEESNVKLFYFFFSVNMGKWFYSDQFLFNILGNHIVKIDNVYLDFIK